MSFQIRDVKSIYIDIKYFLSDMIYDLAVYINDDTDEIFKRWQKHMKLRSVFGKGYFYFPDKVAALQPDMYKDEKEFVFEYDKAIRAFGAFLGADESGRKGAAKELSGGSGAAAVSDDSDRKAGAGAHAFAGAVFFGWTGISCEWT